MNHKELYIIAIIIFLTVIAWISFGIYHARTTSSISKVQLKEIIPLTPTFDNDIIRQLGSREDD